MTVNFFIPKQINVGFQKRSDTYTNQLAYIIYYDEKGKLRKETSWNGWRDKDIDNVICDNEPTSGFVLNKRAGGYDTGWNHRQTYVRVYDPRGFEFEITVQNLLYILENATSTKGKGLEGDFVYGWDGKDLVLIPTDAPDYKELVELNALRHAKNFIKTKELIFGATYRTKDNRVLIYVGRFDEYGYYGEVKARPQFYFYNESNYFETMASISQKLVEVVSEEPVENYADIMDSLEKQSNFSPIDDTKDEYVYYTLKEMIDEITTEGARGYKRNYIYVYTDFEGERERTEIQNYQGKPVYYKNELVEYRNYGWNRQNETRMQKVRKEAESLEEIFNILKPMWKKVYLKNGKLHKEEK